MDIDKNNDTNDKLINQNFDENEDDDGDDAIFLPPPPSLIGLPNPPPAVYNNTKQYQKAIFNHTHKKSV